MRSWGSRKGRVASNKTRGGGGQRHCILLYTRQRSHPDHALSPSMGILGGAPP